MVNLLPVVCSEPIFSITRRSYRVHLILQIRNERSQTPSTHLFAFMHVRLQPPAMYKGATRVKTLEVYAPDLVTTWTSSGTTSGFESIDLSGNSAQHVTVVAVQGDLEWLSILEVSIVDIFPP